MSAGLDLSGLLAHLDDATALTQPRDAIVTWKRGRVRLRRVGSDLHWLEVRTTEPGALADLTELDPAWLLQQGITRGVICPNDPALGAIILRLGYEEVAPGRFECDYGQGSRRARYGAWKRGATSEPGWHKQLR